jgi:hypothetical protein
MSLDRSETVRSMGWAELSHPRDMHGIPDHRRTQDSAQWETRTGGLLRADIQAHAFCRMTRQQIAKERRHSGPMPSGWSPVHPSLLRQAEDQTIVSLAAVRGSLERLHDHGPERLSSWGILAATRFLGRSVLAQTIAGFHTEGVWSVSPHLIPHVTLHSPAGAISLAMGIHGPNLGIGGGPGAVFEGFLTALTWIGSGMVPGLWLVISGWSPDFVPNPRGEPIADCECQALALALVHSGTSGCGHSSLALAASDNGEPVPKPDLLELNCLLSRKNPTCSVIPRPHFTARGSSGFRPRVIAEDGSRSLRIELLLSKHGVIEEDR